MKKIISLATLFVLLTSFVVPVAYAQDFGVDVNGNAITGAAPTPSNNSGFTALAPISGLTDAANTSAVNSTSLANFFNNLYKYVIGIAAILAVIMIIWGGLEYSTQDSVSKKSDGK